MVTKRTDHGSIGGTVEQVEDIVGTMAGASLTYDDANDVLNASGGIWTKDGSLTENGVTTSTYTLAAAYDSVLVFIEIENVSGVGEDYNLRVNGDTTTNYSHINEAGTRTTGASNVTKIDQLGAGGSRPLYMYITGRYLDPVGGYIYNTTSLNNRALRWHNNNPTSPLTSVTIYEPAANNFDISWELFGKDIESAGVP